MISAREFNRIEKAREIELRPPPPATSPPASRKTRTLAEIGADAGSAVATVPRLLDADRIAELLQVTRRHVNHLVHIGEFPKPVLVGTQRRWLASDYNAYVAKLREKQAKRRRHA